MKVFSTVTGKFTRLTLLALLAFLLGQKEARSQFCNANFTYTINQTQGLIYFMPNDLDTLGTHYWNLGGTVSTLSKPTRTLFTTPGSYMIVHAFSKPGCSRDTSVQFITIGANTACNANFNHSVNNTTLQVTFVSMDTLANATHHWSFGGQGSSTLPALVKQFSSAGTYYVTHIISRGSCHDTVSKWIAVGSQSCLAGFTYTMDSVGTAHFTNTSTPSSTNPPYPLNYFWTFGSNNAISTQKDPSFNYPTVGWYKVCLRVTKPDSSCINTYCDSVYRWPNTPVPSCSANFNFTVNQGDPKKIHFTNTSTFDSLSQLPIQFIWSFGDGDTGISYNENHTYATAGNYYVCLTIKRGTCQNTKCKTITVTAPNKCKAGFTYMVDSIGTVHFTNTSTPSSNPPIDSLIYVWSFGDNTSSGQKNPSHYYATNGWYHVCLMITRRDSSCTDMFCDTIYAGPISSPSCHANFNVTVDQGDPKKFHFTNTSTFDSLSRIPTLFIWTFGDGDSAVGFNQHHTYASGGNYQVCLTIKQGNCINTKCKPVTVQSSPGCHASFTYNLYPDSMDGTKRIAMFNNTSAGMGPIYFQWTFGDSSWSNNTSPTHYYPVNGMYKVCLSIWSSDSCQDDTCVTIAILPDSSTGLKNISGLEQIKYYPVPMDGKLHLDLSPENRLDYQITISNALGIPVIQEQGKAEQLQVTIDVADLPTGVYLITLTNKFGSVTKRLMK